VTQSSIVIIGAGQAGFQAAASLREQHHTGRIVLVGDEAHAPYQRPPLSKAYLFDEETGDVALRTDAFFAQQRIELATGRRAVAIDRAERRVCFDDGWTLEYDHLVLATGACNRLLTVPGADLRNVFYLRTLDDAKALREQLATARSLMVIGAGFVGLELAAGAAKLGMSTTVLDVSDRPMARGLSKTMAGVISREHQKLGMQLRFETRVTRLLGDDDGRVRGVETSDGQILPAELVVIGIGVVPNVELAASCELAIEDGIAVDERLLTSDPQISAIGDVAAHVNPYPHGQRVRLESVQNASDQARCVAARLVGRTSPYEAVPWFWSYQGDLKLQMTGLARTGCEEVVRGELDSAACAVFSFHDGRLACVETLNRPVEHMLARRLLATRATVTARQVADPSFDLKSLLPKPGAGAAVR